MTTPTLDHHGGCLCGAIRFRARGAPAWIGLCHCASCRRATGGALMAACGYARENFSFTAGAPSHYASSPGVKRGFCARCGTSLTYESERWPGDIHVMVASFDRPENFAPQFHIFAQERLPWLHLADQLPRFRTTPGAGELMAPEPSP